MTTGKKVLALLALGAAVLPFAAHAMDIKPVFVAGIEGGGDEIASTTDGGSLRANELFSLGGGASFLNDAKDLEFQLTLAWKYGNLNASDGKVSFTRFPLDALVFYRFQKVRVGGGVTYHLNPSLSGSGSASPIDGFKFNNALGA